MLVKYILYPRMSSVAKALIKKISFVIESK